MHLKDIYVFQSTWKQVYIILILQVGFDFAYFYFFNIFDYW
jgi:hypothetical protein